MTLSRRKFLCVLGIGTGSLLIGCSPNNREPDFTVVIDNGAVFEPASLVVPLGSMVAWHNRADHIHTVTADPVKAQMPERILLPGGASPFDSGNLFSGDRWTYTFDVAGTYIYFCRYHELDEMLGTITVTV